VQAYEQPSQADTGADGSGQREERVYVEMEMDGGADGGTEEELDEDAWQLRRSARLTSLGLMEDDVREAMQRVEGGWTTAATEADQ
jgi:hypothetical protein